MYTGHTPRFYENLRAWRLAQRMKAHLWAVVGFMLMLSFLGAAGARGQQAGESAPQAVAADAAGAAPSSPVTPSLGAPAGNGITGGPPDSAALAKDPRLAEFDPPDRQFVVTELGTSEAYCRNDPVARGLLDCDCFAKTVFNYRLTHANDRVNDTNSAAAPAPAPAPTPAPAETPTPAPASTPAAVQDTGNLETQMIGGSSAGPAPLTPLVNLAVSGEKLNCAGCVSDAKVVQWAAAEARASLASPLVEKPLPEAQVSAVASCVGQTFLASFHAKPYLGMEPSEYAAALKSCQTQSAR